MKLRKVTAAGTALVAALLLIVTAAQAQLRAGARLGDQARRAGALSAGTNRINAVTGSAVIDGNVIGRVGGGVRQSVGNVRDGSGPVVQSARRGITRLRSGIPSTLARAGAAAGGGALRDPVTSARAAVGYTIDQGASLSGRAAGGVQAKLPPAPVPPPPVARAADSMRQAMAAIAAGARALASQLAGQVSWALSQGASLQGLLGAVAGAGGRAAAPPLWRLAALPMFGYRPAVSALSVAPSVASFAASPARMSLGVSASPPGAAIAALSGSRADQALAGGADQQPQAPSGNGGVSFSGPFHGGFGLPLTLLLLTFLIPASWRRLRSAATCSLPVIFASPLERPG